MTPTGRLSCLMTAMVALVICSTWLLLGNSLLNNKICVSHLLDLTLLIKELTHIIASKAKNIPNHSRELLRQKKSGTFDGNMIIVLLTDSTQRCTYSLLRSCFNFFLIISCIKQLIKHLFIEMTNATNYLKHRTYLFYIPTI